MYTFRQVIVILVIVLQISSAADILVQTFEGKLRGSILKTRKGKDILAFHGVRYGESTAGKNRFKPPIAARPWRGIRNATEQGLACMQQKPDSGFYIISEDCLFLDVYTKDLQGLKPVIVFIHGGGFKFGAKSDASPDYLLDKDVVFVSINYRLSAFGFLTTGTADASGNFGFKDQNLALKWVQRNIRSFGGNSNRVTLVGHSAGSFSVSLHLVSPMSRGLFHRAVAMSGSAMSHIGSQTRKVTQQLLRETFCDSKDSSEAVQCLRQVSAEKILEVNDHILEPLPWYYDVEPESVSEQFLIEEPMDTARRGGIRRVPIMAGISLDEFLYLAFNLEKNPSQLNQLNANFLQVAPFHFFYNHHDNKLDIGMKLRNFYLNNETITDANIMKVGEIYSDSLISHGIHRFVSLARQNTNVFYYRIDYKGRYSHEYKSDGSPVGVVHGDELQYAFVFKKIAPVIDVNDPENFMIERMTSWLSQFAKIGNPNNIFDPWTRNIWWTPTTQNKVWTMYVNETSRVSIPPNSDRYALWDSLFPI